MLRGVSTSISAYYDRFTGAENTLGQNPDILLLKLVGLNPDSAISLTTNVEFFFGHVR